MASPHILSVQSLRFGYPGNVEFALHIDELAIAPGEHTAIIGPSGSGKTTLIGLLSGIHLARSGQVLLDGTDLASLSDAARRLRRITRIGMLFQDFALLDYLNVSENILLPYYVCSELRLTSDVHGRAAALVRSLDIEHCLARRPGRLSHGEQQRVAVCRALVTGPRLLVCDEPTASLDPRNADEVIRLLFDSAQAHDATLVVVTHDRALLERFTRVVDMSTFLCGAAS
jgi:putative ABC transport system ATP-binding protein